MRYLLSGPTRTAAPGAKLGDGRRRAGFRRAAAPLVVALVLLALGGSLLTPVSSAQTAAPTARAVPGTEKLLGIACPTATSCLAVGDDFSSSPAQPAVIPLAVRDSGLAIGAIPPIQVPFDLVLRGIACPSPGICLAVGAGGDSSRGMVLPLAPDGTALGGALDALPAGDVGSDLGSIACPTRVTCIAVGGRSSSSGTATVNEGEVVPLTVDGTTVAAGAARSIAGMEGLWGVACPTSTTCLGVGTATSPTPANTNQGAVLVLTVDDGIQVSPLQPVAGTANLYGIACPTPARCYAAGDDGTNGLIVPLGLDAGNVTVGTIQAVPQTSGVQGIVCPTGSTCLAAGGNAVQGLAVPIAVNPLGASLGTARPIAGASDLVRVVCPTRASCVAVGNDVSPTSEPGQGVAVLVPPLGS